MTKICKSCKKEVEGQFVTDLVNKCFYHTCCYFAEQNKKGQILEKQKR